MKLRKSILCAGKLTCIVEHYCNYLWVFVGPNQMRGRERRPRYDSAYDRRRRRRSSSRRRFLLQIFIFLFVCVLFNGNTEKNWQIDILAKLFE